MIYHQKNFQENVLEIKDKKVKYYLSPNLIKNNFKHGFFSKMSSGINISLISENLNFNYRNCILNQIHSNKIVLGSNTKFNLRIKADGIVSDKHNQNLWIYTADCMPILFADKKKRYVGAIHCGRKGLEKRIIKNLIKNFVKLGSRKEDLIVAIGPSISKKNYLIDKKTFDKFYKNNSFIGSSFFLDNSEIFKKQKDFIQFKKKDLINLDIKKCAHIQLLHENIPNNNIDISRLCTYELSQNFHSWRRSKTNLRQWNFISS